MWYALAARNYTHLNTRARSDFCLHCIYIVLRAKLDKLRFGIWRGIYGEVCVLRIFFGQCGEAAAHKWFGNWIKAKELRAMRRRARGRRKTNYLLIDNPAAQQRRGR